MKSALLYLWQLPQNIVGLFLLFIYGFPKHFAEKNGVRFYATKKMPSGISLGRYVILNEYRMGTGMQHEYGHTEQSKMLGWFYLLHIGLPSLCGNIYDRIAHKNWNYYDSVKWYYNQPWEKWADKLGGVKR